MAAGTVLSINQVGEQGQLTVSQQAVGLTLPTYLDPLEHVTRKLTPRHALIHITGQPVRWRCDGDPSGAFGFPAAAGSDINWTDPLTDFNALITRIKFIRDTTATGDAILEIAFFN